MAVEIPVSLRVGQVTLVASWRTSCKNWAGEILLILGLFTHLQIRRLKSGSKNQAGSSNSKAGRGRRIRTLDLRFWRPPLYQLSYTPSVIRGLCFAAIRPAFRPWPYSLIEATTPAPTVRPPSRMAKRRPSSMAIGAISSTSMVTLSPGITISVPSESTTVPVTSVVRK